MKIQLITTFLDNLLKSEIEDSSLNGLQVTGKAEVKKIGFAVDASLETFKKAVEEKCDMVIVHHGLIWDKAPITSLLHSRIKFLMNHNISLYASHLPLDVHPKYGNNIQICRMLGVKVKGNFNSLGYWGEFPKEKSIQELVAMINEKLNTESFVLNFGKKMVKTFAVISGGGGLDAIGAVNKKMDAYLTGDRSHSAYHFAKEGMLNMISGGHYATETPGVKALAQLLKEKFKLKTVFLDVPTGL